MMKKLKTKLLNYVSFVFIETFSMIFFSEWGDRSQISTIVLAAREVIFIKICLNVIKYHSKDPYGITVGALFGHCLCTGIAVLSGKFCAQIISAKSGINLFILLCFHPFKNEIILKCLN